MACAGSQADGWVCEYRRGISPADPMLVCEHVHAVLLLAAAGVPGIRGPATEPWGLTGMWIQDPDGVQIVLAGVPTDHPLRRDPRSASPPRWPILHGWIRMIRG